VVSGSVTLHYWWEAGPSSDSSGGFFALAAQGSNSCNGGGLTPAPLEFGGDGGCGCTALLAEGTLATVEVQQGGGAGGEQPVAVLDRVELDGDDGLGGAMLLASSSLRAATRTSSRRRRTRGRPSP
jgi:hypothetical protein